MTLPGTDMIVIAAAVTGLEPADITGDGQSWTHARARMIVALLHRTYAPKVSATELGRLLNKDRTSARYALEHIDRKRAEFVDFARRCVIAIRIARTWKGDFSAADRFTVGSLPKMARKEKPIRIRKLAPRRSEDLGEWKEKARLRAIEEHFLQVVRFAYRNGETFQPIAVR